MRAQLPCVWAAVCVLTLAGMGGCSTKPDTRFYLLTPLPAAGRSTDLTTGPAIGLRPVRLPEELDRPHIVTRIGPNRLQLAEFDQWAAPLRESFTRVLAEDLAILIPTDRISLFPWARETAVDYDVTVEVIRFEGTLNGDCSLVADWTILKRAAKEAPMRGKSNHSERAGESYGDMVGAQSRLIGALGRDIAAALKAMPR